MFMHDPCNIYDAEHRLLKGQQEMGEKAQKRLLRVLALAIAAGLSRPFNSAVIDVPEQRGIKDDIKEAVLEGAVRTTSILVASVLVRRLARSR